MPVARWDDDDDDGQPWHNRTSTVVGASVLAILVIGILIVAATALAREFGETEPAPLDFVAPTYSATNSESAATSTSTTQTITSTSPPETTDIDGPTSSSTTSSSSETSSTPRTTPRTTTRAGDEDGGPTTRTTRQRPRTNVTRTLNPYP